MTKSREIKIHPYSGPIAITGGRPLPSLETDPMDGIDPKLFEYFKPKEPKIKYNIMKLGTQASTSGSKISKREYFRRNKYSHIIIASIVLSILCYFKLDGIQGYVAAGIFCVMFLVTYFSGTEAYRNYIKK